jgi:hypothetical protein
MSRLNTRSRDRDLAHFHTSLRLSWTLSVSYYTILDELFGFVKIYI